MGFVFTPLNGILTWLADWKSMKNKLYVIIPGWIEDLSGFHLM